MSRRYRFLIPCLPLAAWSMGASAQFRCDCTRIVDSCKADVAVSGSSVQITSDHRECSRVDYFIDGQPFVSVAVDGEARQSRPASVAAPRVLVQSCQVCADASLGGAAALRAPGAAPPAAPSSRPPAGEGAGSDNGDGRLEAYIQVQPAYPAAASARRPTGYVEVEYTVNAEGRVEGARVTKSEPGTVFDAAALAAVSRWRYPADPGREPVKLTHRFDFRPPADAAAPAGGPSASAAGAQRPAAPRNDCLREGPVLDYGEVFQVGLQSTCAEPLMVFSCAGGTSAYQGRWLCTDPVEQGALLVPASDGRLGQSVSVTTDEGIRPLTYKDRFFVSRAPNSEYWWLACAIDDAQCRASARLWIRAVDRQVASVDPQGRSALALARSH